MENVKEIPTAEHLYDYDFNGLTKREYFAGLAMQSFIQKKEDDDTLSEIAYLAVEMADKLLEKLEEKNKWKL